MANRRMFYTDYDEPNDSYYDNYSPRTQIPEDCFHGTYSRYELENARSSLVNNVMGATGGIWFQLKYKLGMCNYDAGADYNREAMHQCMLDMHSSEWCHSPLKDKRSAMILPPFRRNSNEITSSHHKSADAGPVSSCGISPANDKSKIVISDSDEDTSELNASSPKDSTMSDQQQERQTEIVIDLDSEPEYPSLSFLYEN